VSHDEDVPAGALRQALDDLADGVPPTLFAAGPVVRAAARRRRRRRTMTAVAAAVVLAGGGAVLGPAVSGSHAPDTKAAAASGKWPATIAVQPGQVVHFGRVDIRLDAAGLHYVAPPEKGEKRHWSSVAPLEKPTVSGSVRVTDPPDVYIGVFTNSRQPARLSVTAKGHVVHGTLISLARYPGWGAWVADVSSLPGDALAQVRLQAPDNGTMGVAVVGSYHFAG
jgi:hypothetical protein